MSGDKKICVGSRKSELALIQTRFVISLLKELNPDKEFDIVTMSTLGDKVLDIPLPKIGEKSLFTKELETALSTGCVDFVVHSLKDLPTTLPPGMVIGAVLTREDPRDALVLHKDFIGKSLCTLPADSTIGTSSLRRGAQIARKFPNLKVENIRGNLNTRLKKLDELGKYQGLILAAAGLHRMGWHERISEIIDDNDLLYAVGQGALAVECRENDEETINLLRPIYDIHTAMQIISERSFLRTLGGGCSAPVAVTCNLEPKESNHRVVLKGAVWSLDGKDELIDEETCEVNVNTKGICTSCPKNIQPISNNSICGKDCLKQSQATTSKCPFSDNGGPRKKQKVDHSKEFLEEDPHKHCPIDLPVGLDFMGKCPYLEQHIANGDKGKCPVNGEILGPHDKNISKCPFMKDGKLQLLTESSDGTKNTTEGEADSSTKHFCGLVSHPDAPLESFQKVHNLGSRLAQKLIEKGALAIMSKAQSHIRNS